MTSILISLWSYGKKLRSLCRFHYLNYENQHLKGELFVSNQYMQFHFLIVISSLSMIIMASSF